MKALVAVLGVALVGVGGAGGYLFVDHTKKINELESNISSAEQKIADGVTREEALRSQQKDTETALEAAQQQVGQQNTLIETLNQKLADAAIREDAFRTKIDDAQSALAAAQKRIAEQKARAESLAETLSQGDKAVGALKAQLDNSMDKLEATEAEAVQLAKLASAGDSARKAEKKMMAAIFNLANMFKEQMKLGWQDLEKDKRVVRALVKSVDDYGGAAKTYLDLRSAMKGALEARGVNLALVDQDDPLDKVDGLKVFAEASSNLVGNISVKRASLYANENWKGSGIHVEQGDIAYIKVSGRWQLGSMVGQTSAAKGASGAEAYRVAAQIPFGATMARVRGGNRVQLAHGRLDAERPGEIEFMCNDNGRGNNKGVADMEIVVSSGKLFKAWVESASVLAVLVK